VNVRCIAATHKDLAVLVDKGQFREDLFFRLDVLRVRVPPLRERGEDIGRLVEHFLRQSLERSSRSALAGFEPEALEFLGSCDWPGNVRQLENLIERLVVTAAQPYARLEEVRRACGIWGTLSLGLFANGQYSAAGSSPFGVPSIVAKSPDALTGLFYGGGTKVLMAQGIGSLIVCSATFATAMAMFAALKAVNLLRVSKEGELQGLDIDQHGISAYPEYVISALSAPHGMGRDTVGSGNLARAPEPAVVGGE
jgi:hypothetical protein